MAAAGANTCYRLRLLEHVHQISSYWILSSMTELSAADPNTTAVLLADIRNGSDHARSLLVARLQPLLTRFAHGRLPKLLRHEQDTMDLVQSTWLKVLDKLDHLHCPEPGMFFSYLRTVLLNSLRESLRRSAERSSDDVCNSDDLESLAAANTDPTDWLAYEQLLQSLEPAYRTLVVMRFEFGMSFAEMGVELGESADGVRMKLSRVIAKMALPLA